MKAIDENFVHRNGHTMVGISKRPERQSYGCHRKVRSRSRCAAICHEPFSGSRFADVCDEDGRLMLTGSAAILSDAAESVTHVAAVFFAAYSLRLSYRPPDKDHLYGHTKISFFSAGFEGAMIILAALFIIYESIRKWMTGLQLDSLARRTPRIARVYWEWLI